MASPKTTWAGFIELGLITIPVTIGKATSEPERVSDLVKDVNVVDGEAHPIDRSERDFVTKLPPDNKQKAIQIGESEWLILPDEEWNLIEELTKTSTLKITDVKPPRKLPLLYTQATYYIRHDPNSKIVPVAMANLIAAMTASKRALVCKWGSTHRQKMVVITAEAGVMVMRQIPFLTEVRVASKMERAHMAVKIDPKLVHKFDDLLTELEQPKFDYGSYFDEGLARRKQAVEAILDGEEIKLDPEPEQDTESIFDQLEKALADATKEKLNA